MVTQEKEFGICDYMEIIEHHDEVMAIIII
jgi:hypothetical protein